MVTMREAHIRGTLIEQVTAAYTDRPGALIVPELELCRGAARIDLAVINRSLDGYEIKSERDTLRRLPSQVKAYGRVLNRVIIVCAQRHIDPVCTLVPSWWGITEAASTGPGIRLRCLRAPLRNPSVDPIAVTQLLWRGELLAEVGELQGPRGLSRQTRHQLGEILVGELSVDDLSSRVGDRLRARQGWRVPARRA
jgi:hypothetical protein